jgi:hypothetical protein
MVRPLVAAVLLAAVALQPPPANPALLFPRKQEKFWFVPVRLWQQM